MKDKIELKIISIDGKIIEDSVDEIYFDIPLSGVTGILPNRTPFAALLHIGIFYTKSTNQVKYYCISGGTLEFKNKKALILADTIEEQSELDKERILERKRIAEEKLKLCTNENDETYENALFSLKKAINRLKLLK